VTLLQAGLRADICRVDAAEQASLPLGEVLLAKGLVTRQQLDLALAEQERTGRLLGAILVDHGFVSGPTLAVALAEQYGVELSTRRDFGTGLWAEIERHRGQGGVRPEDNVFRLDPGPHPQLEAVPDLEPEIDRLQAENRRLQAELERLRSESSNLRLVEAPEQPSSHLVFVPTPERYLLVEREGPPADPGEEVELDEGRFVVGKVGRAPFPGERRPCVFLLVR
jgi:hypothetical protein